MGAARAGEIRFDQLTVTYGGGRKGDSKGGQTVLDGFDLTVEPGEVMALLGPSGSGKSLTLRAIAGLLRPDRGRIELPQGVVFDSETRVDAMPQQRNAGYVVQDLALFPHMTVAENIGFAIAGWKRGEREARV
ncbi:MAG TPA: ATP-binding cassette domain-containing protein, partial [Streptomyces sp.]